MTPALQALQVELAQVFADALATLAPDWAHAAVNYEQGLPEDPADSFGPPINYLAVYLMRPANGELSFNSLRVLPPAVELLFQRLHQAMRRAGDPWGSTDLTLDEDGNHAFSFDYGSPKRRNAVFDEASYERFKPARYPAAYEAGRKST